MLFVYLEYWCVYRVYNIVIIKIISLFCIDFMFTSPSFVKVVMLCIIYTKCTISSTRCLFLNFNTMCWVTLSIICILYDLKRLILLLLFLDFITLLYLLYYFQAFTNFWKNILYFVSRCCCFVRIFCGWNLVRNLFVIFLYFDLLKLIGICIKSCFNAKQIIFSKFNRFLKTVLQRIYCIFRCCVGI